MHGLGAYRGVRQTNSRDAFLHWYERGIRVFEVDLALADDGKYIAVAHGVDDRSLNRLELVNLPEHRTSAWFMAQKLFAISTEGLAPLCLESILALMGSCPDAVFMLDLFGLFEREQVKAFSAELLHLLAGRTALLDRLLIESYNEEMLCALRDFVPGASVIHAVRHECRPTQETDAQTIDMLEAKCVRFVSFPWMYAWKDMRGLAAYHEANLTIFSRSKFNTQTWVMKRAGVAVNLVSARFDGALILVQWPMYMATYVKRAYMKWKVRRLTRSVK
jgi:glycerophosphoryl diester phosphodiesterase